MMNMKISAIKNILHLFKNNCLKQIQWQCIWGFITDMEVKCMKVIV